MGHWRSKELSVINEELRKKIKNVEDLEKLLEKMGDRVCKLEKIVAMSNELAKGIHEGYFSKQLADWVYLNTWNNGCNENRKLLEDILKGEVPVI